MDTNGAFKHKSMGVGNKNMIKPKYFKITFSCVLHKEILTLNEKGIETNTEQLQAELRRAAQSRITLPCGSSSELSGTDKSLRSSEAALVWTQEREIHSTSCWAFQPRPHMEHACGSEFPRKQLRLYKAFLQGNFSAAHLLLQRGHDGPGSMTVCSETKDKYMPFSLQSVHKTKHLTCSC